MRRCSLRSHSGAMRESGDHRRESPSTSPTRADGSVAGRAALRACVRHRRRGLQDGCGLPTIQLMLKFKRNCWRNAPICSPMHSLAYPIDWAYAVKPSSVRTKGSEVPAIITLSGSPRVFVVYCANTMHQRRESSSYGRLTSRRRPPPIRGSSHPASPPSPCSECE
jgi:hypothetical protein